MTKKVYKTAQGKIVDLGALMLQNEHVRAVGNMGVNARGDVLDSNNRIIETTSQRVQKSYKRQTNVSNSAQVVSSTKQAKNIKSTQEPIKETVAPVAEEPQPVDLQELDQPADSNNVPSGGLAAAIARAKTVKQQLEPTLRERQKALQPKPRI